MPGPVDNRRSARETLRIPIKLEVTQNDPSSSKIFFGYTSNISSHGLALSIHSRAALGLNAEILIYIEESGAPRPAKVQAKVSWQAESRCGLEFVQGHDSIQELLRKAAVSLDVQGPFLKKFFPYVGGESVDTRSYEFFPYVDKYITENSKTRDLAHQLRNGELPAETSSYFYAQYALADPELNRAAIYSAYQAFQEFRKFSVHRRRKILDDVRKLLQKEKRSLIELLVIEGHPLRPAEEEYGRMEACISPESLSYFEREIVETVTRRGDETIIGVRRPHGVVCIAPPKDLSSVAFTACLSLFAGNTLVLKPPAAMLMSSIYLWRNIFGSALNLNGAPKGTINVVIGDSDQFIEEWMSNPYVKCIFNFDDCGTQGAPALWDGEKQILQASRGDSLLIWKDAPLEEAAEALLDGFKAPGGAGMAPRRALIHEDIYPQFIGIFLKKVEQLKVGVPWDSSAVLSPVVNEMADFFDRLENDVRNGGKILTGGHRISHLGRRDPEGLFVAPTVVQFPVESAGQMRLPAREKSFPKLPVFNMIGRGATDRQRDQAIYSNMVLLLERSGEGARASVWVQDAYYVRKFIEDLNHSGSVRINSRHMSPYPYLFAKGALEQAGGLFEEMSQVWQKTSRLQWISVTKLDAESAQVKVTAGEG